MLLRNMFLWLIPFGILAGAFLVSRIKVKNFIRYSVYAVILLIAFIFDLQSVSFVTDFLDRLLFLSVEFILLEFGFKLMLQKNWLIKVISFVIIMGIFSFGFWKWILSGPKEFDRYWNVKTVAVHQNGKYKYRLKEHVLYDSRQLKREIMLTRSLYRLPLEKKIKIYHTEEGYFKTPFSYRWTDVFQGIKVDIIDDSNVIWTLSDN